MLPYLLGCPQSVQVAFQKRDQNLVHVFLHPTIAEVARRVAEHILLMVFVNEQGGFGAHIANGTLMLRSELARGRARHGFVRQDRLGMNQQTLGQIVQELVSPTLKDKKRQGETRRGRRAKQIGER